MNKKDEILYCSNIGLSTYLWTYVYSQVSIKRARSLNYCWTNFHPDLVVSDNSLVKVVVLDAVLVVLDVVVAEVLVLGVAVDGL